MRWSVQSLTSENQNKFGKSWADRQRQYDRMEMERCNEQGWMEHWETAMKGIK